jgi:O-antigen ligase
MPDFLEKQNIFLGEGTFYIEKVTDGNLFYPHNLYLDLLYNSGVFLAALFIIFSAIYFLLIFKWLYLLSIFPLSVEKSTNSLKGESNCHLILTLIFLPVYVGTLFSGTLYDNYSVLSVIICIPVMEFNSSKNIGLQNKNLVFKFKE